MIKIGITGSLASAKPLLVNSCLQEEVPFSADLAVKELYQNKDFKSLIRKQFKIKSNNQIKIFKKLIIKKKKTWRY